MAPLGHGLCAQRHDRRAGERAPHSLTQVSFPAGHPAATPLVVVTPGWQALPGTLGGAPENPGEGGDRGIRGQRRAPWHGLRASDIVQDSNPLRSCPEDLHYATALGQLTSTK